MRQLSKARRLAVEHLESRLAPAAKLYLDFGFNFPAGGLTVNNLQMILPGINGPAVFGLGHTLVPLSASVGGVAAARALADDVLRAAQRTFEPFDVEVLERSAGGVLDILTTMANNGTSDAYVIVAGDDPPANPAYGWARLDTGNGSDNLAFAFADEIIRTRPLAERVIALASVAAHEAGHTFGLNHTDGVLQVVTGDEMDGAGPTPGDYSGVNLFSRFDMPRPAADGGGTQNAFALLAVPGTVGLKANSRAYVTGTGAHDLITITRLNANQATVDVRAFSDAARTTEILPRFPAYTIDTGNGILVEAGVGDDRVVIDGTIITNITVRGGAGDDHIELTGDGVRNAVYDVGFPFTNFDGNLSYNGTISLGAQIDNATVISFSELEPTGSVLVQNVPRMTVNTSLQDDNVRIDAAFNQPVRVSGFSGGNAFVPLLFRNTALTTLRLNTRDGNDTIRVGSLVRRLDNHLGRLELDAGAGSDQLIIDDFGFGTRRTYTVTNPAFTVADVPNFLLVYHPNDGPSSLEQLELLTGTGSDVVNLLGLRQGASATIRTGSGDDEINAGSPINVLDTIEGPVFLDAGDGDDSLNVRDDGYERPDNSPVVYLLNTTVVGRVGPFPIGNANVEQVSLRTSKGNDQVVVFGLAAAATTIDTGAGDDVVSLGSGGAVVEIRGAVTFIGGAGLDELKVNDAVSPAGRLYIFSGDKFWRGGEPGQARLVGVEKVSVNSGVGNDVFRFRNFVATAAIHGGAGFDQVVLEDGTLTVTGDPFVNVELLTIEAGATLIAAGILNLDVENAGRLDVAGTQVVGTLNITGTFTQSATASLGIDLGRQNNAAVHDTLNVFGAAMLDGTVSVRRVHNLPNAGDAFPILVTPNRQGVFQPSPTWNLGGGRVMSAEHHGQDVTLVVEQRAVVPAAILDNRDWGFRAMGPGWALHGGGYRGDYRNHAPGTGSNWARWQRAVVPGEYEVYATWAERPTNAGDAQYQVLDGSTLAALADPVDQSRAPTDVYVEGTWWHYLGRFTTVTGVLTIVLSDLANGEVVADAIMLAAPPAELGVSGKFVSATPNSLLADLVFADPPKSREKTSTTAPAYQSQHAAVAQIWDAFLAPEPAGPAKFPRRDSPSLMGDRPGLSSLYDDFLTAFFADYSGPSMSTLQVR